jgi:hypothetical protein
MKEVNEQAPDDDLFYYPYAYARYKEDILN